MLNRGQTEISNGVWFSLEQIEPRLEENQGFAPESQHWYEASLAVEGLGKFFLSLRWNKAEWQRKSASDLPRYAAYIDADGEMFFAPEAQILQQQILCEDRLYSLFMRCDEERLRDNPLVLRIRSAYGKEIGIEFEQRDFPLTPAINPEANPFRFDYPVGIPLTGLYLPRYAFPVLSMNIADVKHMEA